MKKLRLFQDKRKLKIFAIRAMIYLIIIVCIFLLSSIIGRADTEYTLTADYICYFGNTSSTPSDWNSYSLMLSNSTQININDSWNWRNTSFVFFPLNGTGLTDFRFTPSDFLSGTAGNTYICVYIGYVIGDTIYRVNSSNTNVSYGQQYSKSNIEVPANADKFIISIQKGSNQNGRYYTSYPVLSYTPLVPPAPPDPPAPDEWQTLIEFIGYLIDSVVNVFNLTFSIESKLVWALVFGFPILNYVLDFFDEILDQIDASLPADHDLHKYRPAGYQAPNYYDYHFDYDYWIHNKSIPGG